jgi:hypothetical protein
MSVVDKIMEAFSNQLLYPSEERKQRIREQVEAIMKEEREASHG